MATLTVLHEQTVWISPRAVGFTVICDRCARIGELFPSVEGRLELDKLRGRIECSHGHELRVEREGR
jgi:hypothetical protein